MSLSKGLDLRRENKKATEICTQLGLGEEGRRGRSMLTDRDWT